MDDLQLLRSAYPRVSDILGKQTQAEMRKIPVDKLANATLRGIKVHGYCLAYAEGLFLSDVEPVYEPYVNAFIEWYDKNVHKQLHNSVRLYDDEKRFSGEFDLIAEMKSGEIALIDVKVTCAPSKTWPIQLAAYNHLCALNNYKVEKIANLHLKKKTSKKEEDFSLDEDCEAPCVIQPKLIAYPDMTHSWDVFQSALLCYDYFDRKKERKTDKEVK